MFSYAYAKIEITFAAHCERGANGCRIKLNGTFQHPLGSWLRKSSTEKRSTQQQKSRDFEPEEDHVDLAGFLALSRHTN